MDGGMFLNLKDLTSIVVLLKNSCMQTCCSSLLNNEALPPNS